MIVVIVVLIIIIATTTKISLALSVFAFISLLLLLLMLLSARINFHKKIINIQIMLISFGKEKECEEFYEIWPKQYKGNGKKKVLQDNDIHTYNSVGIRICI